MAKLEEAVSDSQILLFLAASMALIVTPGQDMVYVMSRSLAQGARAGLLSAAGVSAGLLVHSVLAAVGVAAIVQASGTLFLAVKLGGAAYLVYLGIKLLRAGPADLTVEGGGGARSGGGLSVQGLASNVANPKIAVFFMAFMPQFVPADTAHPGWMLLTLGAGFAGLTFLVKGTVGLAAGAFSIWLRARPRSIIAMHRISGVVLIALGLRLATQSRT